MTLAVELVAMDNGIPFSKGNRRIELTSILFLIIMNRSELSDKKIIFFQKKILLWFEHHGREFLWRSAKLSTYQYIIAEVLLQRTRAETVAGFYDRFIGEYPNWEAIAASDLEDIESILKPVGLYRQRAVRLRRLADEMVRRNGIIPKDRKDLESIPLIGQYIANAIELIIHNKPSPLIDVNMSRVVERFFGPRTKVDIRFDPYLQDLCTKVVNHRKSKEINWAILDFAALTCKAPKPKCLNCPLKNECSFYESFIHSK
ncbi:MAG: hypothetical protein EOO15_00795 [Chitinophagaceae bacterium]|nr:MAG: hypothetical protein EOO15_00795 [Chitinophagaceae bacterium]